MTEGTTMTSSKIRTTIVSSALLLVCLGGFSQASATSGEITAAPAATATSSVSLAPQAQDMPGQPVPSASSDAPASETTAAIPTAEVPAPATAAAPATVKATTTKASTTAPAKAATGPAAPKTTTAPATVPAAPKTTTAPVNTYKPPSTVGVLTLSCTWNGTEVVGHASWSGYPGIIISVSTPGLSYTSPGPTNGVTVHGTVGLHGACTASGGGQSKSGSA
jgi:hypothetical protein